MSGIEAVGTVPAERYDIVIVGGGSAGCVLANRLSARSGQTVALIEAGVDTPPDHGLPPSAKLCRALVGCRGLRYPDHRLAAA